MEAFLGDVVRSKVQNVKPFLLLSYPGRDETNSRILKIVLSKVHHSQCVVSAENATKMLPVLCREMVTAKIQLLEVFIELHGSHYEGRVK